jgi:hypothetical protein
LVTLGNALGVPAAALREGETAQRFELDREIPTSSLTALSLQPIRDALRHWGDALKLRFTSEFGVRPFAVESSRIDERAFTDFVDDLRATTGVETIRIRLSIDKTLFLRQLIPDVTQTTVVVYIFLSNLVRALAGRFMELEEIFFPHMGWRCLCILLENEVDYTGPYFSIVGPTGYEIEAKKRISSRIGQRMVNVGEARRDQVSWIDFETGLTPYHFMLRAAGPAIPELGASITRVFYALAVIYLADSVRAQSDGFVATFSGLARAQVQIPLQAEVDPKNPDVLGRLFIWAYSGQVPDKLPFVRSVTASYLTEDKAKNYLVLGESAPRIWETTRANYASFIREFVTRHFETLREVDDYVRQTSRQVADQISELSRTLVTTMLATVGIIVGAFAAYILNKEATPKLLSIGLKIYGGYVLLFPLAYFLLFHSLTHYAITVREFNKRMRDFELVLHVPQLATKFAYFIKPRKAHFWAVLICSTLAYGALAAVCFAFSVRLMNLVH